MKSNRRPQYDYIQQQERHAPQQSPPSFRSVQSVDRIAAALREVNDNITHLGEEASRARQAAEEQVRQVGSRERMIAEKRQALEEVRAQTEREIASIGAEIEQHVTVAKGLHQQAEEHVTAQQEAELQKSDLEEILSTYAPGVLEQLTQTPASEPAPGTVAQSDETGPYSVQVAGGTDLQQAPAQQHGR